MARGRNPRQKRPSRSVRHQVRPPQRKPISELTVRLPQRTTEPETVIAHLGPTNSGKTHDALRFLVENGRGVYAAPLRMLAQEAHRRLSSELGEDGVGLVTGEERVNAGAPIICCTAEMAPLRGETLVLDEVQWAEDEERGSAWTRLMLGGEYRHILLLGAVEALPLVQHRRRQGEEPGQALFGELHTKIIVRARYSDADPCWRAHRRRPRAFPAPQEGQRLLTRLVP